MTIAEHLKRGAVPLLALLVACSPADPGPDGGSDPGQLPSAAAITLAPALPICSAIGLASPSPLVIDTVASGFVVPWDLAFLPDGRILVTERGGTVRVIDGEGLRDEPWATFEVTHVAEAGLLGIDLAPDFAESGHVYLTMTHEDVPAGAARQIVAAISRRISRFFDPDRGQVWTNRVVRMTDEEGRGVEPVVVLDGLPSGPIHAGGALRFGPDRMLHVGTGDGGVPDRAPRESSAGGKILRFDPLMPGAPDRSVPTLASGFRNPQGLAWLPSTDAMPDASLLAIDHGPTGLAREGFRRHQDELNHIVPGGNYGWPAASGMEEMAGSRLPLVEWTPAIAPAGLAVIDLPGSPWHGDALVTGLRGAQLRRIVLDRTTVPDGLAATCEEALLTLDYGRLRAIRAGPDGFLYVGTSNRDQRGTPGADDDVLLRITIPAGTDGTH